jgi:hypothetical protein
LSKFVDGRPGHIHAAIPIPPKIFAALVRSRTNDGAKVEAPRVAGNKSFWKKHELGALTGRFARESADFIESALTVEYDGGSLNHCHFETV